MKSTIWWTDEKGMRGRDVELVGDLVLVGSAASCQVRIQGDPAISREHLLLRPAGCRWVATDVGRGQTTVFRGASSEVVPSPYADGRGPWVLRAGDRLQLGRTIVRYVEEGGDPDEVCTTDLITRMPDFTAMERKVLMALAETDGVPTDDQLAARFFRSKSTIRTHLDNIYAKLDLGSGVSKRGSAALYARARFGELQARKD